MKKKTKVAEKSIHVIQFEDFVERGIIQASELYSEDEDGIDVYVIDVWLGNIHAEGVAYGSETTDLAKERVMIALKTELWQGISAGEYTVVLK